MTLRCELGISAVRYPTCRQAHQTQRAQGFTLIELLVVLAVVAIIVTLALPPLGRTQDKASLRAAQHELAAALRGTRSLAMVRGRREEFSIDTTSGVFRAGSTSGPSRLPHGIRLTLVTVAQERRDDHEGGIQFFADGSSSGGGVLLQAGTERGQVFVDWLSGRVSIKDDSLAAMP